MTAQEKVLRLQIKALRAALRIAIACLRGDAAHIVVDAGRPQQGLKLYLQRVLRDTRP